MSNDATEVVVGANGTVWVAPTSADGPTDVSTAMDTVDPDWTALGFITEDGVTPTFGKEVVGVGAWQAFLDIRKIVNTRSVQIAFAMRQWNRTTVELALEATVADNAGEFMVTPNAPETIDERSMTLEWQDGDKNYRFYIPNGFVTENVETQLVRSASAALPITFMAVDPGEGNDAWSMYTDDPAFAAVSS